MARRLSNLLLISTLAGAWLARPQAAEACGTWTIYDRDLGTFSVFFVDYVWPPWAAHWLLQIEEGTPGVVISNDGIEVGGRKYAVEIDRGEGKGPVHRGTRVRISRDDMVVAETFREDEAVSCSTIDELRRLIAAYLVWREELLGAVESALVAAEEDPSGQIPQLADVVVRGPKRAAMVSALVLGRLGDAAIPALEEITARRLRVRRDVVATEMAITALANIGPETRAVLERLSEHRHRDARRAARDALEASALAESRHVPDAGPGVTRP